MIARLEPLDSGRDTEIDMIEREMEGGVVVIQPLDVDEHNGVHRVGGLIEGDEHVDVHQVAARAKVVPKG